MNNRDCLKVESQYKNYITILRRMVQNPKTLNKMDDLIHVLQIIRFNYIYNVPE